jgi:acetate kinase
MIPSRSILCLNGGSSSLKIALYLFEDGTETLLAEGAVGRIAAAAVRLRLKGHDSREVTEDLSGGFSWYEDVIRSIFNGLSRLDLPAPAGVGHRVVHGGPAHSAPARVDSSVLDELRGLAAFAPLHLPGEIRLMEEVDRQVPGIPQVACFDTAFHRGMPELAQRLPLPRSLWEQGLRRYGFHGLSYEYVLGALGTAARGRTVIAHLGNGASMAALDKGRPVDTTMGFTPAGGFMMGTRSGDLDPGVLLYLMREVGYDVAGIDRLVNEESGLRGVSGVSADMRTLLERRAEDPSADQAIELFCYHVRKQVGALAAVLGGIDLLVFTGGIGEKAAPVRGSICRGLRHLGIALDEDRNAAGAATISVPGSECAVLVVPTNEDLVIARHTHKVLSS